MKRLELNRQDLTSIHSQFLDPPDGYGIVNESISRCGPISPANFSFLSLYSFKTVLFIGEDNPQERIVDFLKKNDSKYHRISVYSQRSTLQWRTQMDELVKLALEFIIDKNNHSLLISSSSALLISTIIACMRKIQGWSFTSITDEFRRFTPDQPLSLYKNYVENFDFDLIHFPETSFLMPFQ